MNALSSPVSGAQPVSMKAQIRAMPCPSGAHTTTQSRMPP
jgi:hypothetical protein